MAIKLSDEYTNANGPDASYPGGSFKNASTPTATDGTPFEEAWANDMLGFMQALLAAAGITPSGVPDTAVASQHLAAMRQLMGLTAGAIRAVAVSGPVLAADRIITVNAGAGPAVDLTFLSAADATAKAVRVQRDPADPGDFDVTLLPSGVETLGGEASISLLPGEWYEFVPDGTDNYLQF